MRAVIQENKLTTVLIVLVLGLGALYYRENKLKLTAQSQLVIQSNVQKIKDKKEKVEASSEASKKARKSYEDAKAKLKKAGSNCNSSNK